MRRLQQPSQPGHASSSTGPDRAHVSTMREDKQTIDRPVLSRGLQRRRCPPVKCGVSSFLLSPVPSPSRCHCRQRLAAAWCGRAQGSRRAVGAALQGSGRRRAAVAGAGRQRLGKPLLSHGASGIDVGLFLKLKKMLWPENSFEPRPSSTTDPEKLTWAYPKVTWCVRHCARWVPEHDSVWAAPFLIATIGALSPLSRYADVSS